MAPLSMFICFVVISFAERTVALPHETIQTTENSSDALNTIHKGSTKSRTLYDYQTRVVAFKDLIESRCLLEFLKGGESYIGQNTQEPLIEFPQVKDYLLTKQPLTKRQIYTIGGQRISEFCRGFPTYLIQDFNTTDSETNLNLNVISTRTKRETRHYFSGKIRSQTQSQYLNYGGDNNGGKAEAESTNEGSRAVVSGSSGMGQAQSQSSPYGCDGCYGDRSEQFPNQQQTLHFNEDGLEGRGTGGRRTDGSGGTERETGSRIVGGRREDSRGSGTIGESGRRTGGKITDEGIDDARGRGGRITEDREEDGRETGSRTTGEGRREDGRGTGGKVTGEGREEAGRRTGSRIIGEGRREDGRGTGGKLTGGGREEARGTGSRIIEEGRREDGRGSRITGDGREENRRGTGGRTSGEGKRTEGRIPGASRAEGGRGTEERGDGREIGETGTGTGTGTGGRQYPIGPGRLGETNQRYPEQNGRVFHSSRPSLEGPFNQEGRYPEQSRGELPSHSQQSKYPRYPGQTAQDGRYSGHATQTGQYPEHITHEKYPRTNVQRGENPEQVSQGRYPEQQTGERYPSSRPVQRPIYTDNRYPSSGQQTFDQTGQGRFSGQLSGKYDHASGQSGKFSGVFSGQYEAQRYSSHSGVTQPGQLTVHPGRIAASNNDYTENKDHSRQPQPQFGRQIEGHPVGPRPDDRYQPDDRADHQTGRYLDGGQGGYSGEEASDGHPEQGGSNARYPGQRYSSAESANRYPESRGQEVGQQSSREEGTGVYPKSEEDTGRYLGEGRQTGDYPKRERPNKYPKGVGEARHPQIGEESSGEFSESRKPLSSLPGRNEQEYSQRYEQDSGRYPETGESSVRYPGDGQPDSIGYPETAFESNDRYPVQGRGQSSGRYSGKKQDQDSGKYPGSKGEILSKYPGGRRPTEAIETPGKKPDGRTEEGREEDGRELEGIIPGKGREQYETRGETSIEHGREIGATGSGTGKQTLGGKGEATSFNYPDSVDTDQQTPDDSDSQAQTSIQGTSNGTQASASAQGKHGAGTAQSQVSGTYSGSGSFSASAGSDDGARGAQSAVSGGRSGANSAAQGHGGLGNAQAQVQLGSTAGDTVASAQSGGRGHGAQTQVQAGAKGGTADAQASGPGSTASQAQIGFTPPEENESAFGGGGMASAQSGTNAGQAQSQIQGKFQQGIRYTGAAQAGSGNGNKTFSPPVEKFAFKPIEIASIELSTKSSSKRKSEVDSAKNENNDEADYDEDYYDEMQTKSPARTPETKSIITQNHNNQKQHIVLGPVKSLDATVERSYGSVPHGTILQPGEYIPGKPGYQIPPGFRGHVKAIAGRRTYASGQHSQAQTVNLAPGTGRVIYNQPSYGVASGTRSQNGRMSYGLGYSYQPAQIRVKSGGRSVVPNFYSESRSETGLQNLGNGEKTPQVSYSQSSSCGIFTKSCVFDGTSKLCLPQTGANLVNC